MSSKKSKKAGKEDKPAPPDYGASSPGSRTLEKKIIKKSSYYEALLRERNAWAALAPEERESFPVGKSRTITEVTQLLPNWTQVDLLRGSPGDLHHRTALLWKALVYANEAMSVPHSSRLPGKEQDMAIVDALENEMMLDLNQIEPELARSKAQELFGQERNDDRSPQTNAARDVFMARVSHISAVKRILLWIENRKMSWAIVEHGFEPAPFEDMLRYYDDEWPHDNILSGTIGVDLDLPFTMPDQDDNGQDLDPLPEGWGAIRDAGTGRVYFIDHNAKTATFVDPRTGNAGDIGATQDDEHKEEDPLPEGWQAGRDTAGRLYFQDHNSKSTTYVDPRTGLKTDKPLVFEEVAKDAHILPLMGIHEFPGAPWLVPEVCLAPMENEHAGLTAKIWFHHPTTPRSHAVKLHYIREGSEELTKLVRSCLRPSLRVFVGANSIKTQQDFVLGQINFNVPLVAHLVDLSSLVDVESILSGECDSTPLSDVVGRFCADTHTHKKLEVVLEFPKAARLEFEKKLRDELQRLDWINAFAHVGSRMQCNLDSPLQPPRIVVQPHQKVLSSFSKWHKYRATVTLSLGGMALDDVVKFVLERVSSVAQMIPWSRVHPPTGSMFDEVDVSYVSNEHRGESRGDVAADGAAHVAGRVAGRAAGTLLTSLI